MKLELTSNQIELLHNILSYDCSYLEDITETEFQTYQKLRKNLDGAYYEYQSKLHKARSKQPTPEW